MRVCCCLAAALSCVGLAAAAPVPSAQGLRPPPSADLPLSHPRLRQLSTVEQVHLTASSPSSVFVTWVTNQSEPTVLAYGPSGAPVSSWQHATGPPGQVYSTLMDPRFPASEGGCIGSKNYTNPGCFYTSGEIHSLELTGLTPGTKYSYSVGSATQTVFNFKTPPAVSATSELKLIVVGDLGQTENSTATVESMEAIVKSGDADLILHAGDLSYADGNGYRWDAYARMGQSLWSAIPTAHTGGNHEISNGGENWIAYKTRYPNPHKASGSDSFLWYSIETGPAHIIVLNSYADFKNDSLQARWLRSDLAKVDRSKTPWLIAIWHTPWYTSNHHHPMSEGSEMRQSLEAMLSEAGVDIVFNGHVHAYERTVPVYQLQPDAKRGIPYITIGDGGNREWFATPWNDPQPAWSALREDAFGFGTLTVSPSSQVEGQTNVGGSATWKWMRNANTRPTPSDKPFGPEGPAKPPMPADGSLGDTATYTVKQF